MTQTVRKNAMINGPVQAVPELCRLGVAELTAAYRKHELSPVEVVTATLKRAEAINGKYNAFVSIDAGGAIAAAEQSEARWLRNEPLGLLDGVTATIKDLVSVRGWPLRLGSRTTPAVEAAEDAPTPHALRAAGAILIGATTTPEFGWKGVADSPYSGVTRNPWNTSLTPGGSSGGAAVAALTGAGVLNLGSDGGGSIRIPASFSGVFGHKPTFGRVPYFPPSAFGPVGHLGPITRTVEDSAFMLEVLSARDIRDWSQNPLPFKSVKPPLAATNWKDLKIGLWTDPPVGRVDVEVLAAVTDAAREMENLGANVERVKLPEGNILEVFNTIWFTGAANRVRKIPDAVRNQVDAGLLRIAEIGSRYSAADYAEAAAQRALFGIAMDNLLERYDLLISPATQICAFEVGYDVPRNSDFTGWTEWASFCFPINLSQQPACSLPLNFSRNGLPIGLQIVGPKGEDARVLAAAASFMQSRRAGGA